MTQIYLCRLEPERPWSAGGRDLFLGFPFGTLGQKARTGFEPVLREDDDGPSLGREPGRPASELPADLQRIVERLTKRRGARELGD